MSPPHPRSDDRFMNAGAQRLRVRATTRVTQTTGSSAVARLSLSLLLTLFVGVIVIKAIWQRNDIVVSQPDWEMLNLIWLIYLPPIVVGIVGLSAYRNTPTPARPIHNLISYRIVSRGQNYAGLLATVGRKSGRGDV